MNIFNVLLKYNEETFCFADGIKTDFRRLKRASSKTDVTNSFHSCNFVTRNKNGDLDETFRPTLADTKEN